MGLVNAEYFAFLYIGQCVDLMEEDTPINVFVIPLLVDKGKPSLLPHVKVHSDVKKFV